MSATVLNERKYARLLGETVPMVIESKAQYKRMLAALEKLMDKDDADISPEEGKLLELLAMLIEEYEKKNIPLPMCEPHEMLSYLMEEKGVAPHDLWSVIGSKSRVSEILAGKRSISKEQAKKLAAFFSVPVELLL